MSRYFTKTLASLEPYTPGEQLKIADIVKLNANENPYPPAPGVAAAVAAAVPGLRLYSDLTNGDLNAAIARHWGVRPENILCGNGSDENLLLALRAFCDESTPLSFADVTYSFYTVLCDLLHIPQHIIPLEADLTIDLKKYCGLHETIVIANPNAPTSLLAPVDAIEEVLKSDTISYCGECMSCRPRCPRGNTPGYVIQALRTLSQKLGFFVESEKGRQQLALKRIIGENILRTGYCIVPRLVKPELHPEQGTVWQWIYDNDKEVYGQFTPVYMRHGAGALRRLDEQSLEEINKIFEVSGGKEMFDSIEEHSDRKARELGYGEGADQQYMMDVFLHNNNEHY